MSTCQNVISLALEKLGIIGAGGTPEANDNARGLASLKAYYQKLINSGAFGELTDIIPSPLEYLAGENERIVHDGSVTVTLPDELPLFYTTSDYGLVTYAADFGMVRPPRDLAAISEVNTDTGIIKDFIYDNRVRAWCEINTMTVNSYAPLSHRDEDGLASVLATRLAAVFNQPIAQEVAIAATRFEEALTHNWSQAGRIQIQVDYD